MPKVLFSGEMDTTSVNTGPVSEYGPLPNLYTVTKLPTGGFPAQTYMEANMPEYTTTPISVSAIIMAKTTIAIKIIVGASILCVLLICELAGCNVSHSFFQRMHNLTKFWDNDNNFILILIFSFQHRS